MDQKEHIRQFNRQLDRLISGKAMDTPLSPSDERALELARRLSLANFSAESSIRAELYLRLVKSRAIEAKPPIVRLPRINFSTWAWTALVLMVLLVHSIKISSLQPGYIVTNQPAHLVLAMPSPSATLRSQAIGSQALKPVPVPTPLAISAIAGAQSQPFPISKSGDTSSLMNPARTQTPKPAPLPRSGSRP